MSVDKSELLLVRAICRANLKKTELAVLAQLMGKKDTTITTPYVDLAKQLNIAQGNYVRALQGLKTANVVGTRTNGIYVRSKSSWGK